MPTGRPLGRPPKEVRYERGYRFLKDTSHPRAKRGGDVPEHLLIVERVLGRYLPSKHPIHHVNENRSDNRHSNLVVCESNGYHKLLHWRMEALRACGHADWRKCGGCGKYDDIANMKPKNRSTVKPQYAHVGCLRYYWREAKRRRTAARFTALGVTP